MLVYLYTAIGGLMLSSMLLRTRLVPRGLSVLGLIGYAARLRASVLDMLGLIDTVAGLRLVRARSRRPVRTPPADLALREGIQLDRQ
jgi:hypothetical protein